MHSTYFGVATCNLNKYWNPDKKSEIISAVWNSVLVQERHVWNEMRFDMERTDERRTTSRVPTYILFSICLFFPCPTIQFPFQFQ